MSLGGAIPLGGTIFRVKKAMKHQLAATIENVLYVVLFVPLLLVGLAISIYFDRTPLKKSDFQV